MSEPCCDAAAELQSLKDSILSYSKCRTLDVCNGHCECYKLPYYLVELWLDT